jgi:hypothetical protein
MNYKIKDITGEKHNYLVATKFSKRYNKETYWLWKCNCGNTKEIKVGNVRSGDTVSCGCLRKLQFSELEFLQAIKNSSTHREAMKKLGYSGKNVANSKRTRYREFFDRLTPDISHFLLQSRSTISKNSGSIESFYNQYSKKAKERNLEYTLSLEEFTSLVTQKCYYCNNLGTSSVGKYLKNRYCGIDRKDNNIGYILENCVACCKTCNFMKRTLGHDEFILQCQQITQNMKDKS